MSQPLTRLTRPKKVQKVSHSRCLLGARARGAHIALVLDRVRLSSATELDQQADIDPALVLAIEHGTGHVRSCIACRGIADQRRGVRRRLPRFAPGWTEN